MKYIKKILKLFAFFLLLLLLLPLILYIPWLCDKNFYRDQITLNVNKYTDYNLELENLDLSVYPTLRINLKNIHLTTKEQKLSILELEQINLFVFFLPLFAGGKLEITELSFKKGQIDIPVLLNSFPNNQDTSEKENTQDLSQILQLVNNHLRIEQILLEDIEIIAKTFHPSIYHNPKIKQIILSYESFLKLDIFLNIDYGISKLILRGNAGISPETFDMNSILFDLETILVHFPIYEYSYLVKNFPNLKLNHSLLNFTLKSQKKQNDQLIGNSLDLKLSSLQYLNKENQIKGIRSITIAGNINYPLLSKKLEIQKLTLNMPNLLSLRVDSDLDFQSAPIIKANLSSSFVNIEPILDFSNAFTKKSDLEKKEITPNNNQENATKIYLNLNYFINRIYFQDIQIPNVYTNLLIRNSALTYNAGIRNFSDGYLRLTGEANLQKGISTTAYLEVEDVNLEKFTTHYFGKKMAEGTLFTNIKIQTDNIFGEKDFIKNLTLSGNTNLKDGILLDRADILYPIRILNKIIPDENKLNTNISRFNFIDIEYSAKNERFKIKNLNMSGKIFNTTGSADISLKNPKEDISANLIVSTSIGGAGIKIPMNYSKSSYVPFSIDKVWLASVYTGMVMGGPIGAFIGSALSETANSAIQNIKNTSESTKELLSK